jgi:hypothetical protein
MLVRLESGDRADAEPAGVRPRGWRPALAGVGERRRFDQEMRAVAGAWRGYDQPLSPRVAVFRATALLVAVAAALAFVGPWSGRSRGWVADRVAGLVTHSYEPIKVKSVRVEPPQADLPGYLPLFAVDTFRNRSWATAWRPDRPAGESCVETERAGRSATLVLSYGDAVRVDRVSIRAGLDEKDPGRLSQARPAKIGIRLGDGPCQILSLRDVAGRQDLNVSGKDVRFAKVWVTEAYDAADGPNNLVAISEIEFSTKR